MISNTMHKLIFRLLLVIGLSIISPGLHAQDLDARSPKPVPASHQQKKADLKKKKQEKKAEKGVEKGKKRHMKLQKKNTKKMMKKSKKKSAYFNNDRNEFFIKRWFRKKK